jgi:predicted dehydrogenase
LWDVGVYPLSLAQFIMGGPPQWVAGNQWLGKSGIDEVFSGQMQYANGGTAQISASFCTPFYTFAEIIGTEGRITMNRPFTGHNDGQRQLMFYGKDGDPEEIPVPEMSLYLGEVEDMHDAILDDRSNYLTLTETRNHIQTTLALYQSAQTNQIVTLP